MKTLRVCLTNDLPPLLDRDDNYIYFAYDKLVLYMGQNTLYENFAIVSAMPESTNAVEGMFYIYDTDGSIHIWSNYTDNKIATLEDDSMLPLIQKSGTMFYVNVNKRYVDYQRRTLTLPYNDGSYEMSTSVVKEQMFTDETILKYDTDSEQFKVYGPLDYDLIDWSREFRGTNSDTVYMTTDGPRISARVRISNKINNAIKAASDGLYVNISDKVTRKDFDAFVNIFMDFRYGALNLLERVSTELDYLEDIVSEETINQEIHDILESKYSTIDQALADYNNILVQLGNIESSLMSYTNLVFGSTQNHIEQEIANNSKWEKLGDEVPDNYSAEVDYYEVAKEYLDPDEDTLNVLLQAAVMAYIDSENNDNDGNR